MCGIFGVLYSSQCPINARQTRRILDHLFTFSQSRGQEASGLMLRRQADCLINKQTLSGREFIRQLTYREYFRADTFASQFVTEKGFVCIGHARLDTNGSKWDNTNNAPIQYEHLIGVHNGIITNVDDLWAAHPHLSRHVTVDSEVLLALFYDQLKQHDSETAMRHVLAKLEGSASAAIYDQSQQTVTLGTNTGSLYIADYGDDLFVFASESYILEQLHQKFAFLRKIRPYRMRQVLPRTVLVYDVASHSHSVYRGRLVNEVL
jgi:glutamine phosphoribosylpyrophosphate amidotransferase